MDNRLIITIFFVILPSVFIGTNGQKTTPTTGREPAMDMNIIPMLMTPVDRTGCSTERFCLAEPSNCNPNALSPCTFASARQTADQNIEITLAGHTDGYLAITLSTHTEMEVNDITYVCGKGIGNRILLFSASLNNNKLTKTRASPSPVRGRLDGNRMECIFNVSTSDSSSSRQMRERKVSAIVGIGSFDPGSGALASPSARIMSNAVNLMDPTSDTTNLISNSATILHHSLVQALLVALAIISLALG